MMDSTPQSSSIIVALVCLKTGALLSDEQPASSSDACCRLAEAVPELFGTNARSDLGALFARLGSHRLSESFQELVFVSGTNAHVVQRLRGRPDFAVIAVSAENAQLGLMLSCVRARVLELEAQHEG